MQTLVFKDGQQYGPYDLGDLIDYLGQGSFLHSDLCWQEGWEDWRPLSSVVPPPSLSSPPPPPTNYPSAETAASSGEVGRKKVSYSIDQQAFVGDLSAIVKLAVRAVAECGYTLQNANDSIGMISFVTGMTMSSFQGASCSITFIEIDDNVYRAQTAGKQNLGGAQLVAIDMGSANKNAQKVVTQMIRIAGGNPAALQVASQGEGLSNFAFVGLLVLTVLLPIPFGIISLFLGSKERRLGNSGRGTTLIALGIVGIAMVIVGLLPRLF
jgi:hypothetical protein